MRAHRALIARGGPTPGSVRSSPMTRNCRRIRTVVDMTLMERLLMTIKLHTSACVGENSQPPSYSDIF